MPSAKSLITIAIVALVVTAIVFRVPFARKVVVGAAGNAVRAA